jgi:hypothetical protein
VVFPKGNPRAETKKKAELMLNQQNQQVSTIQSHEVRSKHKQKFLLTATEGGEAYDLLIRIHLSAPRGS